MTLELRRRVDLAERLRARRTAIGVDVTDEFLRRHPDWVERWGELAQVRGIEDAAFHVDFLAGALAGGDAESFARYARWTARVLAARKIAPHFLAENLKQVGDAVAAQLATDEERAAADAIVRAGIAALDAFADGDARAERPALAERLTLTHDLFLQAIRQGNRPAALTIAREALRDGVPVLDLYTHVFQEALYEVGRLWESNVMSVAEEHMATAIVQYVLVHVHQPASGGRGTAVVAGVEGELHQIGATLVADALESAGWDVRFLGSNMPHAGILDVLAETTPDLFGISVTMLFNVPRAIRLIDAVRARFGARAPRIIVGGAAFRAAPGLWQEAGADGFAPDVRSVAEVAAG